MTNRSSENLVGICPRCSHVEPPPYNGSAACRITGRQIQSHADADDCPIDWNISLAADMPVIYVKINIPSTFRSPVAPIVPVPYAAWPAWANTTAAKRQPGETGVGDTKKRLYGVSGEIYKAAMKLLGMPCGCAERQAEFNITFPYDGADGRPKNV